MPFLFIMDQFLDAVAILATFSSKDTSYETATAIETTDWSCHGCVVARFLSQEEVSITSGVV